MQIAGASKTKTVLRNVLYLEPPTLHTSSSSPPCTMATETQSQPQSPELTVLTRVASIPLVATSLDTIHSTLSTNAYTRYPYATAQGLSKTALGYTEPLQKTLSPLLTRADGLANYGLDVVESRYPYPFKTPTEDIFKDLKGRSDQAKDIANKTYDEKLKSPVLGVAQGIDQVRRDENLALAVAYGFAEICPRCRLFRSCCQEGSRYNWLS